MKILILVVSIIAICNFAIAGSWSSYDYGTGTYTTGSDSTRTFGNTTTTSGYAYDYGDNTYEVIQYDF